ncbi:MAG: prolipoprotein diacylglyceryl transferase [Alphaproteobacteria bacterium]
MNEYWVHNIDPIALEIGIFKIRWYGIAYALGFIFAWKYGMWLAAHYGSKLKADHIDKFLTYAVLGVIIGGRLGQVILYYPGYYFSNPAQIFMIWQGGMSFHGGLVGVLAASYLFCRRYQLRFFDLTDNLAVTAPFGLMLGRIANFINGEHAGRVTDMKFAVIFPNISPDPRHPSQLYEAGLEGLLTFIILLIAAKWGSFKHAGLNSGLFLCCYAISRIIVELFRDPEIMHPFFPQYLTYGMLLSLPMLGAGLLMGAWGISKAKKHKA